MKIILGVISLSCSLAFLCLTENIATAKEKELTELSIGDHYRLDTDFDDTLVSLTFAQVYRFHKSSRDYDEFITESLLREIGKLKGTSQQIILVTLPNEISPLTSEEEQKFIEAYNQGKTKKQFLIQILNSQLYSQFKREKKDEWFFNQKSFFRMRDDLALIEDIHKGFEEKEVLKKIRKLREMDIEIGDVLSIITAREHSRNAMRTASQFIFDDFKNIKLLNIHPVSDPNFFQLFKDSFGEIEFKMAMGTGPMPSIPEKKSAVIVANLERLLKSSLAWESEVKIVHPCSSSLTDQMKDLKNKKKAYKVYEFFDDDDENIKNVKETLSKKSHLYVDSIIILIHHVGKKSESFVVCDHEIKSVSKETLDLVDHYIGSYQEQNFHKDKCKIPGPLADKEENILKKVQESFY